jgi:hypothetical protein
MSLQLLLYVHPFGGICRGVPNDARVLRRVSIFDPAVRYPKHAIPYDTLPAELLEHFREVFERDRRGEFPIHLLHLVLGAVPRPALPRPVRVVHGRVTAEEVAALPFVQPRRQFWIDGGVLHRQGSFGPEVVGNVLGGLTRFWAGSEFGFGFYRASEMTVGFVFDAHARGIRDDVRLPRIAGQVIDADAVFTKDRCWFFLATEERGGSAIAARC